MIFYENGDVDFQHKGRFGEYVGPLEKVKQKIKNDKLYMGGNSVIERVELI